MTRRIEKLFLSNFQLGIEELKRTQTIFPVNLLSKGPTSIRAIAANLCMAMILKKVA